MLVTAFYVVKSRDLLAVVMVFSAYSLLSAGMFMVMDAADVAFTEAAVGAGVSTASPAATSVRRRASGCRWLWCC
jgi:multicomponent Na+:H+ antiporter subunit B